MIIANKELEDYTNKVWVTEVVEDNGNIVIALSPDFLKYVGWKEGDTLLWGLSNDGKSCSIQKLNTPEG